MTEVKPSERLLASQPSPEQDQATLDLEAVLNLPQGRRFVLSILEKAALYSSPYTGAEASTNFRLGQHNVGLWLINKLNEVSPTAYPQLLLDGARAEKQETVRVLDKG